MPIDFSLLCSNRRVWQSPSYHIATLDVESADIVDECRTSVSGNILYGRLIFSIPYIWHSNVSVKLIHTSRTRNGTTFYAALDPGRVSKTGPPSVSISSGQIVWYTPTCCLFLAVYLFEKTQKTEICNERWHFYMVNKWHSYHCQHKLFDSHWTFWQSFPNVPFFKFVRIIVGLVKLKFGTGIAHSLLFCKSHKFTYSLHMFIEHTCIWPCQYTMILTNIYDIPRIPLRTAGLQQKLLNVSKFFFWMATFITIIAIGQLVADKRASSQSKWC